MPMVGASPIVGSLWIDCRPGGDRGRLRSSEAHVATVSATGQGGRRSYERVAEVLALPVDQCHSHFAP